MTGVQPCVTFTMLGRKCLIRGEHLTACQDDACRGCLPYPADHGMLCSSCWARFCAAVGEAIDLITHLRSVERGPQSVDGVRAGKPGSKVIIPESWQRADELWLRLSEVAIGYSIDTGTPEPEWPAWVNQRGIVDPLPGFSATANIDQVAIAVRDLVEWVESAADEIVRRRRGSEAAVKFSRRLQAALRSFPRTEDPSPLRYLRCRKCQSFAVEDHPPLHYLDPRKDVCGMCGHEVDPQMREWDLGLYRDEIQASIQANLESAEAERDDEKPIRPYTGPGPSCKSCRDGRHACTGHVWTISAKYPDTCLCDCRQRKAVA